MGPHVSDEYNLKRERHPCRCTRVMIELSLVPLGLSLAHRDAKYIQLMMLYLMML